MGSVGELRLVKKQEGPRLKERWEGHLHSDERRDVGEARAQATKTREDQGLVGHRLPDVAENIGE